MFVQHSNFGNQSVLRCGFTNGIHNSGDHIHEFCEMEMISKSRLTENATSQDRVILPLSHRSSFIPFTRQST